MRIQQQAEGKKNGLLNGQQQQKQLKNSTAWWVQLNEQERTERVWFERERAREGERGMGVNSFMVFIDRLSFVYIFLLMNLARLSCSFLARNSGRSVEWSNPKNKSPSNIHTSIQAVALTFFLSLSCSMGDIPFFVSLLSLFVSYSNTVHTQLSFFFSFNCRPPFLQRWCILFTYFWRIVCSRFFIYLSEAHWIDLYINSRKKGRATLEMFDDGGKERIKRRSKRRVESWERRRILD